MSDIRHCRDGHRCEHGSPCIEDPASEGSYFCDCSRANGDYAGLYCEYEAETYCNFPQEVSETWFCTNGGTCVVDTSPQSSKFKCDCQLDFYEGPHCEYIKDALPNGWPDGNGVPALPDGRRSNNQDSLASGIKAVIVIVALIVVGLLALLILQRRRAAAAAGGDDSGSPTRRFSRKSSSMNAAKDPSQALQLEADGSMFQERVKSNASTPQSDDFDFEAPDALSVEVERPKTPTNHFSTTNGGGGHGRII